MQPLQFGTAYRIEPGMPYRTDKNSTTSINQEEAAIRLLNQKLSENVDAEIESIPTEDYKQKHWYVLTDEGRNELSVYRLIKAIHAATMANLDSYLFKSVSEHLGQASMDAWTELRKLLEKATPVNPDQ